MSFGPTSIDTIPVREQLVPTFARRDIETALDRGICRKFVSGSPLLTEHSQVDSSCLL